MKHIKHGFYSIFGLFLLLLQMCHNPSITEPGKGSKIDSILNAPMPADDCGRELQDSIAAIKQRIVTLKDYLNHKQHQQTEPQTRLDNVKLY